MVFLLLILQASVFVIAYFFPFSNLLYFLIYFQEILHISILDFYRTKFQSFNNIFFLFLYLFVNRKVIENVLYQKFRLKE